MNFRSAVGLPSAILGTLLVMVACQPSCGSSAQPAAKTVLDIRGSWKMVAVANGVNYPQTMDITTEDRSTGALAGIDVGAGQTFTVTGTVSSTGTTFKTTGGGYTSNSAAKISGSGVALTMTGQFTDSNHTSGTFTAIRTSSGGS